MAISTSFVLASCGPSDTGGPGDPDAAIDVDAAPAIPDAATPDASIPDASPDAGPDSGPDATPCIPFPDGELCNGVDDDCDDEIDEGFPGVGAECDVGVGACEQTGNIVCTPDGSSTECSAVPGDPATELCDTLIDEDCDGFVDEGFASLGQACTVGIGACESSGTVVCTPDRLDTECDAVPGTPGTELCGSGVDEDCDNQVDEGFPDLGDPCTNGVGACERSGQRVCDATGLATECDAVPGLPTGETCDGLDNDCDGTADDGNPDGGASCSTGESGICAAGTETCSGGTIVCQQNVPATTETCNGLDDDCDGSTDEGFNVGDACDGADGDQCAEGVIECNTSGGTTCSDNSPNNPELCNGEDDDCDGTIDEGYVLGEACDGSDGDQCEDGVTVCNGAGTGTTCNDPGPAIAELCNGADDDCDGSIDEGFNVGATCDGSDGDLCQEGTRSCNAAGTGTVCSDNTTTTTEACNGDAVDEDCDGTADEGFTLNDNSTCPTYYMGSVAGDTGSGHLTDSWWNEEWDYFTITENNDLPVYLSAQIVLYNPPGVDYDLYVYCQSCGGSLIGSSTAGGLSGHYDVVYVYNDDDWGSDDEIDVYVEVRYWTSNRCAWWELDVYGNVDVDGTPYGTCNQ